MTDIKSWNELFLVFVAYFSGTIETFVRAFCFGYGLHVLLYLFHHPDAKYEDIRMRMKVSMIAGLAFGCLAYGGSMVSPIDCSDRTAMHFHI